MMKNRILLTLAVLLIFAATAYATPNLPERVGGVGFLTFGSSPLDLSELDESLEAHGLPASKSTFSFGAGGYGFIDRLVLGSEGYLMIGRTASNGAYNSRVDAGMGLLKAGYVVYQNEHFRLYPLAGIGGGGVTLQLQQRNAPTFDELLNDPGQESSTTAIHLLLDLGVGADYLVNLGKSKDGTGNLVIGLRAGYTFSPAQSEWRMGDQIVPNGPSTDFTGPYIRLVIGAGGSKALPAPETGEKI
jgi:opacity protein-like surface antigen